MSQELYQMEGVKNCVPSRQIELQDICVQTVFALEDEVFVDYPVIVLPSVVCNCVVENVEVTSRNIFFNCDNVLLCIEYNICLKLFPKAGDPFCQTFQACFTKTVDFDEFDDLFGDEITLEEFQTAEGACVIAFPFFFDCFIDNEVCATAVVPVVAFFIVVKLWRERNVLVLAVPFLEDFPTEKLPKVVNSCGLPNLAVDGNNNSACANARSAEQMAKIPAAKKNQLEKAMAEKKEEFAKKFEEIKKMMGK